MTGALLGLAFVGATSSLVYYMTPSELLARPDGSASVRLYGLVESGSVRWDDGASTLSFRLTDGSSALTVVSSVLPTGLFREGIGVVVAGRLTDRGTFRAEEVLVKHSEVYEPLRPGDTPPPDLLERLRSSRP